MAIVTKRRASGRVVHYVVLRWRGRQYAEPAGSDRRAAERLETQRKREIKAGTYGPPAARAATTVRAHLERWLDARKNRTADNDRDLVTRHVLEEGGREWFVDTPLTSIRPIDAEKLADELGGTLKAPKSITYVYGLVRQAFGDAARHELIGRDPFAVAKPKLSRRIANPRTHYGEAELRQLFASPATRADRRMLAALAVFTGMREGEVCGRRWRDWDREARPLGALRVHTQYDDQPLKTDDDRADHPRMVPVHPALARMLEWWWSEGFERFMCRRPTADDFIVPTRAGANHTKSSAYKAWRSTLAAAGVGNRSLHSTRHTFLTLARRGGAPRDVVETITHNAAGTIVDQYTHWEWEPLCAVMLCFPDVVASVDADRGGSVFSGSSSWTRSSAPEAKSGETTGTSEDGEPPGEPPESAGIWGDAAGVVTRQRLPRALSAALTAGPAPHVVALAEAYQAAMRKDAAGARDALAKCAAELGLAERGKRAG